MQIVKKLTNSDMNFIAGALRKLFVLHDRKVEPDKLIVFTEEIVKTGYSLEVILSGIEKLYTIPLDYIPLDKILEFISKEYVKSKDSQDKSQFIEKVMSEAEKQAEIKLLEKIGVSKQKHGKNWFKFVFKEHSK